MTLHKLSNLTGWIGALFLTLVSTGESFAQKNVKDSVVVFNFVSRNHTLMLDYKGNKAEFARLALFVKDYRQRLVHQGHPIFVDGICASSTNPKFNRYIVKQRSNELKSYLITKYGLKEGNFITTNHVVPFEDGCKDMVSVSFKVKPKVEVKSKEVAPLPVDSTEVVVTPPLCDADTIAEEKPIMAAVEPTVLQNSEPLENGPAFESGHRYALLEKSSYYVSLSTNFKNASTLNLLIEPIFDIHSIYNHNFDVYAAAGYFVKDNVSVGAYGGYKFSDIRVDVSSDILQLLINSRNYQTNNVSTGFSVGAFTKTFIPLEYRNRIFLVNEASLFYEQVRSLSRNVYDRGAMLSKVYQNTYSGGIKLSVGVMFFLADNFSLDFNISPIAAAYQYNQVLNNETLNGAFAGGAINTIILPLDMKFCLSYFFGLDNNKNRRHINQVTNNLTR